MVYSTNLMRHIPVPIELLNNFDQAEVNAALAAIPGYPDIDADAIRAAAAKGDINARFILQRAAEGDEIAVQFV